MYTFQGVVLDASNLNFQMFNLNEEEFCIIYEQKKRLWLVLDSIQDPMNFGAILRSSYFLGVEKIFVTREYRYVFYNNCHFAPHSAIISFTMLSKID